MYAKEGEELFEDLVGKFPRHFRKIRLPKSNRELIELALEHYPEKVKALIKAKRLNLTELALKPQGLILDWLFNTDTLLAVNLGGGKVKLVSVDVTTNPKAVAEKEQKFLREAVALRKIGIEMGVVVYWAWNEKSPPKLEAWAKELYTAVKQNRFATSCIFCQK